MTATVAESASFTRLRHPLSTSTDNEKPALTPSPIKTKAHVKTMIQAIRWLPFLSPLDFKTLTIITTLAIAVRLAILSHPFDEVHFGGFAAKYIRNEYFGDVHPPLARLLVTLSAYLGGFKGNFSFYDIGADYLKAGVPYVTMRAFTAALGALVVPIAFVTLRCIGVSTLLSGTAAAMMLFENALTTQSRLILLDSYLVFFTATTTMFWALFSQERHAPFKVKWWTWLVLLGVSLGLVASCKWVGLFVVATIGIYTIADLWKTFGDVSIPLHFMARAACLILAPLAIYACTFYIHFALLTKWSVGASGMSVGYQQTLIGGELAPAARDVFYGSQVSLRQSKSEGGYLHSHQNLYPEGSKQQQVTVYHHRDDNNAFIIRRPFATDDKAKEPVDEWQELVRLKHGDLVRLEHAMTGRFLHSHPLPAPIADKEHNWEVSGYGHHPSNFSDMNDNWRVEIVDGNGDAAGKAGDPIHAITGLLRLVHMNMGCVLNCANRPLPEWGFKQGEVTCGRETLKANSIWFIETNSHPKLGKEAEFVTFPKKGFWAKFVELNVKMWITNKGLAADHPFGSRPGSWPVLSRGLGFWNGNHVPRTEEEHRRSKERDARQHDPNYKPDPKSPEEIKEEARLREHYKRFRSSQIYLLGNPLTWFLSVASLVAFIAGTLVNRFLEKRAVHSPCVSIYKGSTAAGFLFISWLMHWAPFFAMQRQLFLHHYLPALYFSILLLAVQLNHWAYIATGKYHWLYKWQFVACAALTVAVIFVFGAYAPLTYGLKMTRAYCRRLKVSKGWDFDCESLMDSLTK